MISWHISVHDRFYWSSNSFNSYSLQQRNHLKGCLKDNEPDVSLFRKERSRQVVSLGGVAFYKIYRVLQSTDFLDSE